MRNQNVITKNLTLAETIAHRTPEIANEMLMKNGYPASHDRNTLAHRLNLFILKHQDKALTELASIHPDKDLLFENFAGQVEQVEVKHKPYHPSKHLERHHNCCGHMDGEFSNCSGCGGSCGAPKHFNVNGDESVATKTAAASLPQTLFQNNQMMAIIGIISLIGIVAIVCKNSK